MAGRKGLVQMVEVVIAVSLLFIFIVYTSKSLTRPDASAGGVVYYKEYGKQVLKLLDTEDALRHYVLSEDANGLNAEIGRLLPLDISHSVDLCYVERCVNATVTNTTVYAVSYVVSGYNTTFKPAEVILLLWR